MKKLFALVLATLMVLSMAACSAPAEGAVMKKVKESGKLVVGTEAQYAPYEFKDLDANFAGCDM